MQIRANYAGMKSYEILRYFRDALPTRRNLSLLFRHS